MSIGVHPKAAARAARRRVYFAQIGQYVKVGCSTNPARRIKTLRYGSLLRPDDLDPIAPAVLLHVMPGGFDGEFMAQAALIDHHAVGEWFHATPEVLSWIKGLQEAAA